MKTAKIIIGANFGDEGKGLMTDYFAKEACKLKQSCLVVCHNGGSQKGHTVVHDGMRHVFGHFGSGCFEGADSYLAAGFIVNPYTFNQEVVELENLHIKTKTYVNGSCLLTTPFDMLINQIAEEQRGMAKHGSCGLGIYETIIRNQKMAFHFTISEFETMDLDRKKNVLMEIAASYVPERLKELGITTFSDQWSCILSNRENIIDNYMDDFNQMMQQEITVIDDKIMDQYEYVIFEGAQGLLLDQSNTEYMPHLTPSNTGLKNPLHLIAGREPEIEICYVTRTYMTRHGAGRFDSECRKEEINPNITDLTNIQNPYQDSIRYGSLDLEELHQRIMKDLKNNRSFDQDQKGGTIQAYELKISLAVTHWNEYKVDLAHVNDLFHDFTIYISDNVNGNVDLLTM